ELVRVRSAEVSRLQLPRWLEINVRYPYNLVSGYVILGDYSCSSMLSLLAVQPASPIPGSPFRLGLTILAGANILSCEWTVGSVTIEVRHIPVALPQSTRPKQEKFSCRFSASSLRS